MTTSSRRSGDVSRFTQNATALRHFFSPSFWSPRTPKSSSMTRFLKDRPPGSIGTMCPRTISAEPRPVARPRKSTVPPPERLHRGQSQEYSPDIDRKNLRRCFRPPPTSPRGFLPPRIEPPHLRPVPALRHVAPASPVVLALIQKQPLARLRRARAHKLKPL